MASVKIDNLEGTPNVRALRPEAPDESTRVVSNLVGGQVEPVAAMTVEEMAFTRQGDIDTYARGLSIPPETIEKWISAGLLFPDEIRMAEKIIKILREKTKVY
jgi:hypothetical protein